MIEGLLSPMHLIIILGIALLVLGPKRLPEAGKGLGTAMRGFKDAISGSDDNDALDTPVATPAQAALPAAATVAVDAPVAEPAKVPVPAVVAETHSPPPVATSSL